MPFCLDDHGREQLERGKETLATARDMRAIHTLTVREMLTVLRSETVDYEEVRKRGPALERSLTPDAWLEDGMKFVRRTIRELTLIASTEIQPDQQYSSKPSSNSKPTKFRASTKFTGDSPVFTLIYPSDTVDSGAMSPQDVELCASIAPWKNAHLEKQMERFLKEILFPLSFPYGYERRLAASAKTANMVHDEPKLHTPRGRNRTKEIKKGEREAVNSLKKMHIRHKI